MPVATKPSIADPREQECAKWLARLERGIREDEGRQLKEWLKDTQNRDTILEAAGLWHSRDVQSLLFALTGLSPQQRSTVSRPSLLLPLLVALASTAGFVMMLMSGRHREAPAVPAVPSVVYATAIGETRQITLPDSTRVTLNTNTQLSASFLVRAREVVLVRGEATFEVAHEAQRPFNVIAGRRTFQALGTRFNVRLMPAGNVDLIVTDGQVKVLDAPPGEPTTPARRRDVISWGEATVSAFEEALVDPGFQSVSPIDANEIQARLAWHDGLIVLDDRALEDALAEVERYTPTKFVLADPKLGALRVSGRLPVRNVNAFRLALRQQFLVASRRDTRGRIVLSPAHTR